MCQRATEGCWVTLLVKVGNPAKVGMYLNRTASRKHIYVKLWRLTYNAFISLAFYILQFECWQETKQKWKFRKYWIRSLGGEFCCECWWSLEMVLNQKFSHINGHYWPLPVLLGNRAEPLFLIQAHDTKYEICHKKVISLQTYSPIFSEQWLLFESLKLWVLFNYRNT